MAASAHVKLVLTKMIEAEFLLDRPCGTCGCKEGYCLNYFCLHCGTGGLCSTLFQAEGSLHFGHAGIRVFKSCYQYVVREADMRLYFDTSLVMKYNCNDQKCLFLRTRQIQAQPAAELHLNSSSKRKIWCVGCSKTFKIPGDRVSGRHPGIKPALRRRSPGIVCSLQCLLLSQRPSNYRRKPRKQSSPIRSPLE